VKNGSIRVLNAVKGLSDIIGSLFFFFFAAPPSSPFKNYFFPLATFLVRPFCCGVAKLR